MPFWRCYYHFVWATKYREAVITPAIEAIIMTAVQQKSLELDTPMLGFNTAGDHCHAAVMMPPKLAAADWIRQVKGLSTRQVNEMMPNLPSTFRWQVGYGVLTFGAKNLPYTLAYIEHQKEHHAQATLEPYLETIDEDE